VGVGVGVGVAVTVGTGVAVGLSVGVVDGSGVFVICGEGVGVGGTVVGVGTNHPTLSTIRSNTAGSRTLLTIRIISSGCPGISKNTSSSGVIPLAKIYFALYPLSPCVFVNSETEAIPENPENCLHQESTYIRLGSDTACTVFRSCDRSLMPIRIEVAGGVPQDIPYVSGPFPGSITSVSVSGAENLKEYVVPSYSFQGVVGSLVNCGLAIIAAAGIGVPVGMGKFSGIIGIGKGRRSTVDAPSVAPVAAPVLEIQVYSMVRYEATIAIPIKTVRAVLVA
jgi:hypothetical protein